MLFQRLETSAKFIQSKITQVPVIGMILGSGLGSLVDAMENKEIVPYADIPDFPQSHVAGHAGNFVFGTIGGQTVVAMQGRIHFYEGLGMKEVAYPVYVMKRLGVRSLIVTNACGGIRPTFKPGDLMLINDFINLLGDNPLIGENDERLGIRFPDMSEPYSKRLIAKAKTVADSLGVAYQEGVYALFNGPCYETAAEIRAYASLGADAVGMSTVPETIAANYLGMEVLGISCITNLATGLAKEKHSHEEVLAVANRSSEQLCAWIRKLLLTWDDGIRAN